jgi:anti-anti-sigma factor
MSAIESSPLSVPISVPIASELVTTCHTAHFSARWPHPAIAVVSAHGELDAANAQDFAAYALQHVGDGKQIVLDLAGVEFFGTAGFSALHTLNVRCAAEGVEWAMVPSSAVARLLRICDPDATLPVAAGVEIAIADFEGEPRPLLQLVPETS